VNCPWCDNNFHFALGDDGGRVKLKAGDIVICAACTQLGQLCLTHGIVRFSDAALHTLEQLDPDYAMDLIEAQAVLRQIDRRQAV
jgi:hypothetical protein